MIDFSTLLPKNLYHSYVIESEAEETPSDLLKFLELRGEVKIDSPDVLCERYDSFTIEDSYHIKEWHSQKGLTDNKKICIIFSKFINREAEQTLLKIIEEPSANTHFFLIVPDSSILLDTILSRVQVIKIKQIENNKIKNDAITFLESNYKKRIDQIASVIKSNKDGDGENIKFYAISLVNELENIFYSKFEMNKGNEEFINILEELIKSRSYLNTQGASVKMILENLALMI